MSKYPFYPEDDEREVRDIENAMAEADDHFDMMTRDMRENRAYRGRLEKKLAEKTVDPLVLKALQLAQNLGHAIGANEALGNKIKHMESRIDVRDEELKRTNDRDDWRERALAAEGTIERSKKARAARRR